MQKYEYKVVAAPRRAKKFKGVKGHAELFARTVEEVISEEAAGGWEYLRADTLPAEQKTGLMRKGMETFQTLLIFRRPKPVMAARESAALKAPIPAPEPTLSAAPAEETPGDERPAAPRLGAAHD